MLDLRVKPGSQGDPGPSQASSQGIPPVGARVGEAAEPRSHSPILDAGPRGTTIASVEAPASDRSALYAAIVMVAVAGIAGLTAQYFAIQENQRAAAESERFNALQNQLATGETAEQLSRIRTTAAQLRIFEEGVARLTPWPEIIGLLGGTTPGSVRLTTSRFDVETGEVVLEGEALAYSDVAFIVEGMEQSERFGLPQLESAVFSESAERSVIAFSLTTTFVPQADPGGLSQSNALESPGNNQVVGNGQE